MNVYDGEKKILGRLAAKVAEDALSGEEVRIVNSEKIFVTGEKTKILEDFKSKREKGKQMNAPDYPRRPERIFKRTVRGMIPHGKPRGRKAFKRVRAYIGMPPEFEDEELEGEDLKDSEGQKGLTLEKISKHLGANF